MAAVAVLQGDAHKGALHYAVHDFDWDRHSFSGICRNKTAHRRRGTREFTEIAVSPTTNFDANCELDFSLAAHPTTLERDEESKIQTHTTCRNDVELFRQKYSLNGRHRRKVYLEDLTTGI
jgi:hypothetical protein